jgi:hypothetical protein
MLKNLATRDHIYVAILPIIICLIILFGYQIFSGQVLFWGAPSLQFIPWWQRALLNLQQGQIPLWNPDVGMGAPLIANYQLAFFYPLNWFYLFAGFFAGSQGIAWVANFVITLHLFLAAVGMLKLSQELGLSRFAQIISALAFAFSGYLVARAWFLSINATIAWLPWIMLFSYKIIVQGKRSGSLDLTYFRRSSAFWLFVFCLGLQLLAGHAQSTFFTLVLLVFWILFWVESKSGGVFQTPLPTNEASPVASTGAGMRMKTLLVLGVAIGIAFLVAMVQLLPTAEFLQNSPRSSEVDYELAMTYSLWPWRLIGLLAPNFFGNPVYGNFWGYGNYWEDALYIGLLPLVCVVSILLNPHPSINRRLLLFLGGIVLISFTLALGKNTPIYPFLYQHIPGFDMFQAPTRWSILGIFALSLLAGIGAEFWGRPSGRRLYWSRLGTAGAFAITLGAGLGWLVLQGQAEVVRLVTMVGATMVTGLTLFCVGLLKLSAPVLERNGGKLSSWHWIAIALLIFDMGYAGWGLNPGGTRHIYPSAIVPRPEPETGRIYMSAEDEQYLKFKKYFQFQTFNAVPDWTLLQETLLPNINSLLGLRSALNYDPLVSARMVEYLNLLDSSEEPDKSLLMNLANVSVVVKKDLTLPSGAAIIQITPGPYIRWYSCAQFYPDAPTHQADFQQNLASSQNILFLQGVADQLVSDCESETSTQIQIVENSPQYKLFQVESDHPGWVFVSESYFPGWKAKLNGSMINIYPANLAFQAVAVPSGINQLEIYYLPDSFMVGSIISIIGVILCFIGLLLLRGRNQQDRGR